ncbi:MAG TPA: LytR C-terminal domain-containing protein [Actinomycetota bacterium]|nr:LytR C-terminal domain-containing protein [Actinomycetota bacterium]
MLVVFLGLFWGIDRVGGDAGKAADARRPAAAVATASSAAATTTGVPATTGRPATTAAPTGTAPPTTREPAATGSTLRPAAGVTVQVLNGTLRTGEARRAADMLSKAGYDVIATQLAFGGYPVSRVYYNEGHLEDAIALRQRFPVFQLLLPASESRTGLSRKVDLSAVVGRNFR